MDSKLPLLFRPILPDDFNFIINSWLLSSRESFPYRHISKYNYNTHQTPILQKLLNRSNTLIAADIEDPKWIIGYLVYEVISNITILYFIYVKRDSRNFGVARSLLLQVLPDFGEKEILITSLPQKKFSLPIKELLIKYNLIYDPYIIERRK